MHSALLSLEKGFAVSSLQLLDEPFFKERQLEVWIKRDDLLHPVISGNKWRKLKYILDHALSLEKDTIVSMGGAYSNHLHALAFAGKSLGLKTRALIRGERPTELNPTLKDLEDWGMELDFVSRCDYRLLRDHKEHDALPDLKYDEYWLPEGGALSLALQGVGELVAEIKQPFDCICSPCGTGTTLAGIIQAVPAQAQVLGFAALKGASFLLDDIAQLLAEEKVERQNWQVNTDYHFGGFAKTTPALLVFISEFEKRHGIPLEPVYSGKMLFALYDLIERGYFKSGLRIIVLHTGGLQGRRGFENLSIENIIQ